MNRTANLAAYSYELPIHTSITFNFNIRRPIVLSSRNFCKVHKRLTPYKINFPTTVVKTVFYSHKSKGRSKVIFLSLM